MTTQRWSDAGRNCLSGCPIKRTPRRTFDIGDIHFDFPLYAVSPLLEGVNGLRSWHVVGERPIATESFRRFDVEISDVFLKAAS